MAANAPAIIITLIVASTIIISYCTNKLIENSNFAKNTPPEYSWIVHGLLNIIGYATVFVPGYLTLKYVKKINYLNKSGNTLLGALLRTCFAEEDLLLTTNVSGGTGNPLNIQRTTLQETVLLLIHFFGLQVSYLSWGVLQEKVMTQEYTSVSGQVGKFKDSQFLVFVNRVLAFLMAAVYLMWQRQPRHKCPLYKYVFCSFSNIISSWCQYEALKYVSFPHQVLAKAAKTIPVMIMGKIVSRTKYEYYEYVTAVILSIGMLLFMLDAGNDRATNTVTTVSGAILLCSYIAFDSFTSNWQGALFKTYSMKPVQMMCFVNLFSCVFTSVSLLQQNGFADSFGFMIQYPRFVVDCVLLSICSATGQLFIFSTISHFGPLVFAIISTIRQGFSVLLSCVIYEHNVNGLGVFGLVLVFVSVLLRIYCGHRVKSVRKSNSQVAVKVLV